MMRDSRVTTDSAFSRLLRTARRRHSSREPFSSKQYKPSRAVPGAVLAVVSPRFVHCGLHNQNHMRHGAWWFTRGPPTYNIVHASE